ncbi:MAG TPA: glycosyltransferase [Solirubrobacteraceae bacterium]|nr:glycosyltransferase [Solirubrobacteraceae bacterium]
MRALIVTNMYPSPARPALGTFVRDQVRALQRRTDVEIEVFAFAPGGPAAYPKAAAALRQRYRHARFDVVHAHFGLTAWPALAAPGRVHAVTLHGMDLIHPRSRPITLAALRFLDLVAVVSDEFRAKVPRWATRQPPAVLPCGVDIDRFHPIPRHEARVALGLDPDGPYLLFPHDPARPVKRHDLALKAAGDVPLLTLGRTDPSEVPLWVNAANAVLLPSEWESFGTAVLEALACNVPVLATPTGIAPVALNGLAGTYCGPFDLDAWRAALAPHLSAADPRVEGRAHAEPYSSDRMAAEVVSAWRAAHHAQDPKAAM